MEIIAENKEKKAVWLQILESMSLDKKIFALYYHQASPTMTAADFALFLMAYFSRRQGRRTEQQQEEWKKEANL